MPSKKFNHTQRQLQRIGTDVCDYAILYEQIKYHTHASKYVYLTYKAWPHNLEWPLTILAQHECNYGKVAHFKLLIKCSHITCTCMYGLPLTPHDPTKNAKGGT